MTVLDLLQFMYFSNSILRSTLLWWQVQLFMLYVQQYQKVNRLSTEESALVVAEGFKHQLPAHTYINREIICVECIKKTCALQKWFVVCNLKEHSVQAKSFISPYWSQMKELFWACWVRWRSAEPMRFDPGERYSLVYEWAGRLTSRPWKKAD